MVWTCLGEGGQVLASVYLLTKTRCVGPACSRPSCDFSIKKLEKWAEHCTGSGPWAERGHPWSQGPRSAWDHRGLE